MSRTPDPCPPFSFSCPIAIIVSSVYLLLTDFLTFEVLAPEYFELPGMQPTPDILFLSIGYVILGYLFVSFYSYVSAYTLYKEKEITKIVPKQGVFFGAVFGLILSLPQAFIYHAILDGWDFIPLLVESVYHIAQFAIAGSFIAFLWQNKYIK